MQADDLPGNGSVAGGGSVGGLSAISVLFFFLFIIFFYYWTLVHQKLCLIFRAKLLIPKLNENTKINSNMTFTIFYVQAGQRGIKNRVNYDFFKRQMPLARQNDFSLFKTDVL